MHIDLQKEMVSLSSKVADTRIETTVEADVIVPDTKQDIGKILQVDALAKISGSEIQNDRIMVYGNVTYQILYMPEGSEGGVSGITAQSTFTDIGELRGIEPGMRENVACDITSVEFRVLNGRKLNVKALVDIGAEVYKDSLTEAVVQTEGGDLEKLQKHIDFIKMNQDSKKSFLVSDKLVIPMGSPSAKEILKVDGKITDKVVKVINNKVIVKGDLSVITIYTDEADDSIRTLTNVIPFTEILEVDGITPDWDSHTNLDITGITWKHEVDDDGEGRIVNVDVEVESKVVSSQSFELDAISDCYSISENVNITKQNTELQQKVGDFAIQTSLKDRVIVDDNAPKFGQIYNVVSKAYIDEITAENNKILVKGVADTYILYITDDKETPLYSVKKELEFSENIDCPGAAPGVDCITDAQVFGVTYTLNDNNSAEIRCNVSIDGLVVKKVSEDVITDIECVPRPENVEKPASITVYFVQDKDSLWEIAKNYSTTVSSIVEANELANENLTTGKQLIIPKYR